MKKAFILSIVTIAILTLSACSSDNSSSINSSSSSAIETSSEIETSTETESSSEVESSTSEEVESSSSKQESSSEAKSKNNLGDYNVKVKSFFLTKDYEKKDVIVVSYEFTNNSKEASDFSFSIITTAYQDGVELESAFVVSDKKYDSGSSSKKIKPGKTITVQKAYVLADTKTEVEIEAKELISFSDEIVTKTFKLAKK